MRTHLIRNTLTIAAFGLSAMLALGQGAGKETLAVGNVQTNKALVEAMARSGKTPQLERIVGSIDHQLISALVQSRKFAVVGRSDLKQILEEQNLGASGIVDATTAAEQGKVLGAKYKLVATVDNFLDENTFATFASGRKATKRRIQISAQAVIYDTTTSEAVESCNLQVEKVETLDVPDGQISDATRTDELMPLAVRELADKITMRTVDVLLPAKIIDREGKQVTINRGDSLGMKAGEIWAVYGPTKTIKDPDSGEIIKRKGTLQGSLRITSVEPTYSQGDLVEDNGVVVGSVVSRLP